MPTLDPITGLKPCSNPQCSETNPSRFDKNRTTKDGLAFRCKRCAANHYAANSEEKSARATAYYWANRETVSVKRKECYRANPEKTRAQTASWRKSNSEKQLANSTASAKANPEKRRASCAAWQKSNPSKVNATTQGRLARKRLLPVQWAAEDWAKCLEHFGHRCVYCGRAEADLHQDHVIPIDDSRLSDGFKGMGGTVPWNMVPACPPCNISKSNKDPFEHIEFGPLWLHLLGRIIQQPSI
jgi:5-methylcytosine-specific restriction endonuclease McrA